MTQKIKSWKEKVSIFFQNCAKKELETEKETAKQSTNALSLVAGR